MKQVLTIAPLALMLAACTDPSVKAVQESTDKRADVQVGSIFGERSVCADENWSTTEGENGTIVEYRCELEGIEAHYEQALPKHHEHRLERLERAARPHPMVARYEEQIAEYEQAAEFWESVKANPEIHELVERLKENIAYREEKIAEVENSFDARPHRMRLKQFQSQLPRLIEQLEEQAEENIAAIPGVIEEIQAKITPFLAEQEEHQAAFEQAKTAEYPNLQVASADEFIRWNTSGGSVELMEAGLHKYLKNGEEEVLAYNSINDILDDINTFDDETLADYMEYIGRYRHLPVVRYEVY